MFLYLSFERDLQETVKMRVSLHMLSGSRMLALVVVIAVVVGVVVVVVVLEGLAPVVW